MKNKYSSLGQKIKRYRLINDIRQEDMAEKMMISRATLINYEKGHTAINTDFLNRLKNHYPDFDINLDKNQKPKIMVNNTIDFRVLSNVIIEKRNFIFFSTLIFAIIGTSSSFLFKKYYNAQISLYPAKKDVTQSLGQFQALAANFGMNSASNEQNFNIADVVRSRLIAKKAVNNLWEDRYGSEIYLVDLWKLKKTKWSNIFVKKNDFDSLVVTENAIKKFYKHIQVSEDKLSGLIKISTTFQDPFISASIANFIGSEVENYIQKENSAQSTKEKLFIQERLLIVKKELEISELDLKDFKERNLGYQESPELFMIFSQLFREVEAKKEVYLTLQKQLELARIEEVKTSPILHVLDSAVPPITKTFPNRILFLVVSAFVGLLLSTLHTIFKY